MFVALPMVGVWCNWRVLLCLMVVRATIVCYMSCVAVGVLGCRCLLRFVVVGLCCVLFFGLLRVAVCCCCVLFSVVPCVVVSC